MKEEERQGGKTMESIAENVIDAILFRTRTNSKGMFMSPSIGRIIYTCTSKTDFIGRKFYKDNLSILWC
jgi:hypothetical protein